MKKTGSTILLLLWVVSGSLPAFGQTEEKEQAPSPYHILRAEENYAYLKGDSPYAHDPFDSIKFISLNDASSVYLTFGGEVRPRFEYFGHEDWEEENATFYSQRLSVHGALSLGSHVRLFSEVYHGLLSRPEKEFAQDDALDLHQGFVELKVPVRDHTTLSARVGRQELAYGSARLVGMREGPNIRRSFDAARMIYKAERLSLEGFVGSEVGLGFDVFDNTRNDAMTFWGFYGQYDTSFLPGATQFYYFGFDVDGARYAAGTGPETRHTLGIRRYGRLSPSFQFNTELMIQFGTFGDSDIFAFAFETDYHYAFHDAPLKPVLGLKLDYISGDRKRDDGKLNTFNPMFTNPAYFGLLGQITPVNMIDVHPSLQLEVSEQAELVLEWDVFWRARTTDGLYSPPRFLKRAGQETNARFIGHQPGAQFAYRFGRHLAWSAEVSYFITGGFIRETGPSRNILHVASTLSYKI